MSSPPVLDILLLLALPASGKSEVRRYLHSLPGDLRARDFHLGDTVQVDDFPYVHFLRRVDEELEARGKPRRFYGGAEGGFLDPRDWGTLLHLVNEDHKVLVRPEMPSPSPGAAALLADIDRARELVGAPPVFAGMDSSLRSSLVRALRADAEALRAGQMRDRPPSLEGRTVVIEFARGGPEGAAMPLEPPRGYAYSLAQLSREILKRAAILYVWVTPEESRRRNTERADPDDPGSILHHSVPESVMRGDYGCDDIAWLMEQSPRPDTVQVTAEGREHLLPIARFDNRVDRTSFVRRPADTWTDPEVRALHEGLQEGFGRLWAAREALSR